MNELLEEVRACDICKNYITPRPVVFANEKSKILIIGQAPGTRVHASGVPWDDASGKQLRKWLDVTNDQFYNVDNFGIIPMGFCYPGKGKTGDLPPRKECAPQWHKLLLNKMPNVELVLLIGMYAQKYYLQDKAEKTLTNTVSNYQEYLPNYFVLPHPSPRNRFWLTKNPWFEKNILPELKNQIRKLL